MLYASNQIKSQRETLFGYKRSPQYLLHLCQTLPLSILFLRQPEIFVMASIIEQIIYRAWYVTGNIVGAEETRQRRPLFLQRSYPTEKKTGSKQVNK